MSSSNTSGDFILQNIHTGEKFILPCNKMKFTCGRYRTNHITTSSAVASRKHCFFIRVGNELYIVDRGSTNGIYINGVTQQQNVMIPLKVNDIIGLGYSHTSACAAPWRGGAGVFKYLERHPNTGDDELMCWRQDDLPIDLVHLAIRN